MTRKQLDDLFLRGPQEEDEEEFYEECMGLLYDKIYRSMQPRAVYGIRHANERATDDIIQVSEGTKPIAWVPGQVIINSEGREVNNAQDEINFTSEYLQREGFNVIDIQRGDFNLVTAYNRWIVYTLPKNEWRAKLLARYIRRSREEPLAVNQAEYHIVVGILLGYPDADILEYLRYNELRWPQGGCYDASRCQIHSKIENLTRRERVQLDFEFSGWLRGFELIAPTQPNMSFFDYLERIQPGLSEIGTVYLKDVDVTVEDLKYTTEFTSDAWEEDFAWEVGYNGTQYSLEQVLRKMGRIASDVTREVHECHMDIIIDGPHTAELVEDAQDDLIQASLKRKRAQRAVCQASETIHSKERLELTRKATTLLKEATLLERGHVYDFERVCPFDIPPPLTPTPVPIVPTAEESLDLQDIVLASASIVTRVKKAFGAELTTKQQAELNELEREKYHTGRDKKKLKTDLATAIVQVQRRIINLKSDITKYDRVIHTTTDRKLKGLPNQDVRGSVRNESHDDTIDKTNNMRSAAENELRVSEKELEALLREQKSAKARMVVTASCPKVTLVHDTEGSNEEANRLYAALTTRIKQEENVYLLYMKPYHNILREELMDKTKSKGHEIQTPGQAQRDIRLVQRLRNSLNDPGTFLNNLPELDRSETMSALRHIDDAYEEIKRMSER